jgi:hypothetical protein
MIIFALNKDLCGYIYSFKNLAELSNFLLSSVVIIIDLITSNNQRIEMKSSLYSYTTLVSYYILVKRLNKVHKIGSYINVFGKIIIKSIPLCVVLIVLLVGFLLPLRNRSTYYNGMNDGDSQMSQFNNSFEFDSFKILLFSMGQATLDNMGIDYLQSSSLLNFFIYSCFIFIMSILFMNIFTGIALDALQDMMENSEAESVSIKIEYVFLMEKLSFTFQVIKNKLDDKIEKANQFFEDKLVAPVQTFYCHYLSKDLSVKAKKKEFVTKDTNEIMAKNIENIISILDDLKRQNEFLENKIEFLVNSSRKIDRNHHIYGGSYQPNL